jgi:uncharacterized protein
LAHDIKHATRTAKLARQIAIAEGYDPDEAEAAGLLHDIGRTVKDSTIPHGHEGAPIAKEFLDTYTSFSDEAKKRIVDAIYIHSDLITEGKLNQILQDADKLDGLGSIGISRVYMTHFHKPDFDPANIIPEPGNYYGKTKNAHEQMALQMQWYSMLYTQKAKEIGKPRYEFMEAFMDEFKREVEEAK